MERKSSVRLTYEDYLDFPDDGRRWELIDGEAHVTPAPKTRHQRLVGRLHLAIGNHVAAYGGGEAFIAPTEVRFGDGDVVQPDIVYVATDRLGLIDEARVDGPPTWLVEVLSDQRRDRQLKRQQYERFGVDEYWIVDPDADTVEVYQRGSEGFGAPTVHRPPASLSPRSVPELHIDLTELFARA